MVTKTITFPFDKNANLTSLALKLTDFLEKEKKLKLNVALTESGFSIKGESKEDWKMILGCSLRITIDLAVKDDKLTVTVGNGAWTGKIIFAVLGVMLLGTGLGFFLLFAAGFGVWLQSGLLKKTLEYTGEHIKDNNSELMEEDFRKFTTFLIPTEIFKFAEKIQNSDKKRSIELYKAAAEKKVEAACVKLGRYYYNGEDVEKDLQKAFDYWSRYPEKLDPESALQLADMYRDGNVTEKDLQKAFDLYRKAPEEYSSERIMEIFEQGTDIKDYIKYAAGIYAKRFEAGEKQLLDKVLELYKKIDDQKHLEKYQIIKAQTNSDPDLALELGKKLYGAGKKDAVRLLELAEPKNDPDALFMLGQSYLEGKLTDKDDEKAVLFLEKAMQNGSKDAVKSLCTFYKDDEEELISVK